MLGRELPMPSYLVVPPPAKRTPIIHQFITELEQRLQGVHEINRQHSKKQHVKQRLQYNRNATKKTEGTSLQLLLRHGLPQALVKE